MFYRVIYVVLSKIQNEVFIFLYIYTDCVMQLFINTVTLYSNSKVILYSI